MKAVGGEQAVKQLLVLLKDADANVKTQVTAALTAIGGTHIKVLIPAMKDSDANVNAGASNALVAIGPEGHSSGADCRQGRDSPRTGHRRSGEDRCAERPSCHKLLSADDQDLRMAAADALGKIGSKDATAALLKSTGDIAAVPQSGH